MATGVIEAAGMGKVDGETTAKLFDIIGHVAAVCEKDGVQLTAVTEGWQKLFFSARRDDRAPAALRGEQFRHARHNYPQSKHLQETLHSLAARGILKRDGKSAELCHLDPKSRETLLRQVQSAPPSYREFLEASARRAREIFREYAPLQQQEV